MQQKKIQIKHCITKRDLIQIHQTRIDDHRAITQLLNGGSHDYHTFKLVEEKILRAVLNDIPQVLPTEKVKQNLVDVGFEVFSLPGCT